MGAVVVLFVQAPVLLSAPLAVMDPEASHTPAVAAFFSGLRFLETLWLQPNEYCTGCSVDGWLAAGAFAAFGRTVLAWKAVGGLYLVLLAAGGFRWLRDAVGVASAWAWVAMLGLAPSSLSAQLWTPWGGHVQGVAIAVFALSWTAGSHPQRWLAVGIGLAAAWVFTLGATPFVVGLVAWLAWRRAFGALRDLALGLAFAPLGWWATWRVHPTMFADLAAHLRYHGDDLGVVGAGAGLFHPHTLGLLWGPGVTGFGQALGVLVVGSVLAAGWTRLRHARSHDVWTFVLGAWLVAYAWAPDHVDPSQGEVREARYAVLAVVIGALWLAARAGAPHLAPRARAAWLAPWILAGIVGRAQDLGDALGPTALTHQDAVDLGELATGLEPRKAAVLDDADCGAPCTAWTALRTGMTAWPDEAQAVPDPDAPPSWHREGVDAAVRAACLFESEHTPPAACARVPDWHLTALATRLRTPQRHRPHHWDMAQVLPTLTAPEARRVYVATVGRGYGALWGPWAPGPPCDAPADLTAAYADGLAWGIASRWRVETTEVVATLLRACVRPADPSP